MFRCFHLIVSLVSSWNLRPPSLISVQGTSASNVPRLVNIEMELRKCCNHPWLIVGAEDREVGLCVLPFVAFCNLAADDTVKFSILVALVVVFFHKALFFVELYRTFESFRFLMHPQKECVQVPNECTNDEYFDITIKASGKVRECERACVGVVRALVLTVTPGWTLAAVCFSVVCSVQEAVSCDSFRCCSFSWA